jgi:hypothetical protein
MFDDPIGGEISDELMQSDGTADGALERRASNWTREGRSKTLNLPLILSRNPFRLQGHALDRDNYQW